MSDNTPLGDRMKAYEHAFRQFLPRRAYTIVRVDGRAFHSYLREAERPFDHVFMSHMDMVAQRLCEEIGGAQFAYVQSDEISILMTDFADIQTQPWFGGNRDKIISVTAGIASAYMSMLRNDYPGLPHFDGRAYSKSDPVEVANYFVWRQRDAVRNSIQMVGQFHFSQTELHGKSTDDIQEMLWSQHGVNWNDCVPGAKRGRLVYHGDSEGWVRVAAPHFKAEPDSELAELIPALPSLKR